MFYIFQLLLGIDIILPKSNIDFKAASQLIAVYLSTKIYYNAPMIKKLMEAPMRKAFHSSFIIFTLVSSFLFSTHPYHTQSKWVIAFDCWGVLYENAYTSFLNQYEFHLKKFLDKNKDLLGRELGYPAYYMDLADKIDQKKITDEEFYGVLSQATGEPPLVIKEKMNDVMCLHKEVLFLIKELKKHGHRVILVANSDRGFLQKFLDYESIESCVDQVFTSSQLKARKSDVQFWQAVSTALNIPFANIILVDDSQAVVGKVQGFGVKGIHYDRDNAKLREKLLSILG
jgi:FMN phosphatase YigB (HAD superfamily)